MPDLRTAQGEPITTEMLDALAVEAEAGYDPGTVRPRNVGRPSLGSGTSPRVQFRINPTLYQQAQEQAEAEHRTISELARDLLEDYVRRTRSTPKSERQGARGASKAAARKRVSS
jgi:hypothetical protein